jgi:hypothetical protein
MLLRRLVSDAVCDVYAAAAVAVVAAPKSWQQQQHALSRYRGLTAVAGTRDDPLPATGSFATKLVKSVRSCPVLVVKANSRGPYLRSDNGAMGKRLLHGLVA